MPLFRIFSRKQKVILLYANVASSTTCLYYNRNSYTYFTLVWRIGFMVSSSVYKKAMALL